MQTDVAGFGDCYLVNLLMTDIATGDLSSGDDLQLHSMESVIDLTADVTSESLSTDCSDEQIDLTVSDVSEQDTTEASSFTGDMSGEL